MGKLCLILLGKVCLVAGFAPCQKQIVQRLLFLTPLLQFVSLPLLIAQFAENFAVLMSALVDGKLLRALSFKLLQSEAQHFGCVLEFHFALSNLQQMDSGQFQGQLLFPLLPKPILISLYSL